VIVAIASNRSVALAPEPLVEQAPPVAPWRARLGRALPVVVAASPPARLRRCVHRRLDPVARHAGVSAYAAECLYDGPDHPEALGDLDAARRACEACTRIGLWRADED